MLRLLLKTLGKEFYRQHAGLFLCGIYVLFGIVEPSQLIAYHKSLLLAGISSFTGIGLVICSWCLYCLKVYFFINQKLGLPEYHFIKETGSQARSVQLNLWLRFYAVILLPIIIYLVLLSCIGMQHHLYCNVIIFLLAFIILLGGLAWLTFCTITSGFLAEKNSSLTIKVKLKKPFFSWPIFHLINEQPLMLFFCKILSLALLKGILWLFADVGTDIRVLLIALLASVLCHAVLVNNLLRFEISSLQFVRSLPLSLQKRLRNWLIVFAIILIPEWLFLAFGSYYNLYFIATGLLFSIASLFFFLTLLYINRLDMKKYLKWLLGFFFIIIWVILGHSYIFFSVLLITWSILFYLFKYHNLDLTNP